MANIGPASVVAPAQLTFVSNLFTSKIFLTQVVALAATVANAAGYRVLDDPMVQQQAITILDLIVTALLRWLFPTGPVSVGGPVSTPANQDIQAGASVVTVVAQAEQTATNAPAVQKLETGTHTVSVLLPAAPGLAAPTNVLVSRV